MKKNYEALSVKAAEEALRAIEESGIEEVWRQSGCRVNLVGSLRMGLIAKHRDIDFHVYSKGITEDISFAIAAKMSRIRGVEEITCINGLNTDEHCLAWHVKYRRDNGELWQFDIIHIEEGTEFDGYFERMADRIASVLTPEQKEKILELKFEMINDTDYHGVEIYEAVIAHGVSSLNELDSWVKEHRKQPAYYWIP